jgi:hypothetical protein
MTGKNEEKSGHDLFQGTIPAFTWIDGKYGTYVVTPLLYHSIRFFCVLFLL